MKILDIIFLNENNSDTTRKLNLTYVTNNITKCKVSYYKEASAGAGWNSNENATIFDLEKKRNLSFILAKDMNVLESVGFTGIVSTINESSPAYKYILVDTRTLGTTGYKRRIMIGDNLNNKVIYTDFPTEQDEILNYYIYLRENAYIKDGLVFLTTSTENWSFYEGYDASSPLNETSTAGIVVDNQTVFTLSPANGDYFPEETQAYIYTNNISSITCSNSAGIVETIVNTNPSYKRLYIEDPKIRPLQVGDKIISGTTFYFNFPDDFWQHNITSGMIFNTDHSIGGVFIMNDRTSQGTDIVITDSDNSPPQTYIYQNGDSEYLEHYSFNNGSKYVFETSAMVNEVNVNNDAYPYVLVDITTLG